MNKEKKWYRFTPNECSVEIFYKLLGIHFYWPYIRWNPKWYGINAVTSIAFRNPKSWDYIWAGFIRIFGFGIGFAYNHCMNPNYDENLYKKYDIKDKE